MDSSLVYRKKYLFAGDVFVSTLPHEVTTVLGSCVSICLWDPFKKIGGINHYIKPASSNNEFPSNSAGEVAISNLINKMLNLGCKRQHLLAGVFGGGTVLDIRAESLNIGEMNVLMANQSLEAEGIKIKNSIVSKMHGLKIHFNTYTGNIIVKKVGRIDSIKTKNLKR